MSNVSVQDVERAVEVLKEKEERARQLANRECFCESNANDLKGPCPYCQDWDRLTIHRKKGEKILAMKTEKFRIEAPIFLAEVR